MAERGAGLLVEGAFGRAFREGQRVVVAIEGAPEAIAFAISHHRGHADICGLAEVLATKGISGIHLTCQVIPICL